MRHETSSGKIVELTSQGLRAWMTTANDHLDEVRKREKKFRQNKNDSESFTNRT